MTFSNVSSAVDQSLSKAKTIIVAVTIAAGMFASEAALFATAAKADPNRQRSYGVHRPSAPRHFDPRPTYEPRHDRREYHRDRNGDAVAATVLGIGALIIGAAMADAARRSGNHRSKRHND